MNKRSQGMDSAKVIQVIETTTLRGTGTQEDNCRQVKQYWSLSGELLAENDPYKNEHQKDGYPIDDTTRGLGHTFGAELYVKKTGGEYSHELPRNVNSTGHTHLMDVKTFRSTSQF